jgi:tripartite-type tricarboxylate transporter receptor subunit TctC
VRRSDSWKSFPLLLLRRGGAKRRGGLALVLAALIATAAHAQNYPSRPIRLIVPFPPGGSTDILARALAQKITEGLGQAVVIDNRPGAGGSIGSEAAAKAAPDGYTLMMGHLGTLAVNPAIYKNLPYDPVKSFAPVALMAIVPSVLVVNPRVPATNASELIAYARANPGKLTYGSAGSGSTSHLTTEYFKLATGTDILHVPYKGIGPMLTDLISGQISIGINGAPAVMQYVNSGRLRALAVTGAKRLPSLPQIPTLDEAGVKGFDASGWYGIVAPAGTPGHRGETERRNPPHHADAGIARAPGHRRRHSRGRLAGGVRRFHCRRDRALGRGPEARGDRAAIGTVSDRARGNRAAVSSLSRLRERVRVRVRVPRP